jgi:hypothetical protein
MFGDHMSDAGPIGSRMLEQSALVGGTSSSGRSTADLQASSVYEQRRVPFMAWSNEGNTKKDCGVLSVTQLLPTVFSEYDVAMPKYFSYLKYTQSVYPACASGIIVNTDGSFNSIDEMTDEQKEVYDEQELMEYDYLFGKNYIEKLYEQ